VDCIEDLRGSINFGSSAATRSWQYAASLRHMLSCGQASDSWTLPQPPISPSSACDKRRRAQLLCYHTGCVYLAHGAHLCQAFSGHCSLSIIHQYNSSGDHAPHGHLHLSFLFISLTLARRYSLLLYFARLWLVTLKSISKTVLCFTS
jgi:hypothetical protein